MTLSATLIAERYRVERHIERGGMGSVWLARDDKLGRAVALKVMNLKLVNMPIAVSRFEREARA
ncbi:MAG TPA: serine/threonine protein kinase, partial [Sorangium sp.]|nr:serine/threonine protein kinase [Sorangium sp.]